MTISRISSATAESTSVTIPTHAAGDLLVMFVFRDDSTIQPTIPSGWVVGFTSSGSTSSALVCCKIAASAGETSGTFTSARFLVCGVYRSDSKVLAIGSATAMTATVGSGGNISYTAITKLSDVSARWLVAGNMHKSNDVDSQGNTASFTNVASLAGAAAGKVTLHDTNAHIASYSAETYTLTTGTSALYRGIIVEVVETAQSLSSGGGGPLISGRLVR